MNLNETEVNDYLQPFLGQYEDTFQQAWVDILESNPQTLEEITPIVIGHRSGSGLEYCNSRLKAVRINPPD
jgi:hypothetical protein